jgi:hypothetical protein
MIRGFPWNVVAVSLGSVLILVDVEEEDCEGSRERRLKRWEYRLDI